MVLSALYVFPSFADSWTVWTPDSSEDVVIGDYPIEGYIDPDDLEDEEGVFVASPSNATPSNAKILGHLVRFTGYPLILHGLRMIHLSRLRW